MHKAKATVYVDAKGNGYVGRHPVGTMRVVGRRGAVFTDEQVAALGLTDLEDHTDYDTILSEAAETGAFTTVRADDGSIVSVPAGGAA